MVSAVMGIPWAIRAMITPGSFRGCARNRKHRPIVLGAHEYWTTQLLPTAATLGDARANTFVSVIVTDDHLYPR
jgi:hypothetical protein